MSGEQEMLKEIQGSVKNLQGKLDETVADFTASTVLVENKTVDVSCPINSNSLTIVKLGIERYV